MLPSLKSESTSDLSLTEDSRILESEPEVEDNREKAKSESSDDKICSRVLVDDSETMEPKSGTNNNNLKSESERSRNGVCH